MTEAKRPEFKHVKYFVTGAVMLYWLEVHGKLEGNFQNFLEDSLTKVWLYLHSEVEPDASFHDFQCVLATDARLVFGRHPRY